MACVNYSADRSPRKGDRIGFGTFSGSFLNVVPPKEPTGTVDHIGDGGNLCWFIPDNWRDRSLCSIFIWRFDTSSRGVITYNNLVFLFEKE